MSPNIERLIRRTLVLSLSLSACTQDAATPPPRQAARVVQTTLAATLGTVILAGGGSEGNQGDTTAWSYRLYRHFILNGDTDSDGVIRVAIVATSAQSAFLRNYFRWIGQTLGANVVATDYTVANRSTANNATVVGPIANADALFIKGGDQGVYYDQWNGTLLETTMRSVATRGGAVGGTSAGAMSMAQYCFSGGKDLVATDVLKNARTSWLDDASQPGTSAIHTDFLSFLPGTFVESHYTSRGRLGRLLGVLARATEDNADPTILAIGLEERTGVAIVGGAARVVGIGEVAFVHQSLATARVREVGRPLVYTELVLDRLTDGWDYDLAAHAPVTTPLPAGVVPVSWPGVGSSNAGSLNIDTGRDGDAARFGWRASFTPNDYGLTASSASPLVRDAVALLNAGLQSTRGNKQETVFRALYDRPNVIGILGFAGGTLSRSAIDPDKLGVGGSIAAIFLDAQHTRFKGLSPARSNVAVGGGSLKAAALTDVRVSVLGESALRALRYDTKGHALVP